ncbi:molybdate ABC transporter substrate-binding protein [Marinobacter sp. S0848L]|uniref:molybdate ABC transporter substrate-binding protein n=1 Tax=Marinobacter sp. S0848L TaxID=2926423 RepID=UPI001FF55C11|nr:molybdate ABC transporter substrate-binding protein [Marinobacter sp. S0848L]MCK0105905.1 molybdate ABC transporter substrate-binding protein [Marinobacter sp. S0848L]
MATPAAVYSYRSKRMRRAFVGLITACLLLATGQTRAEQATVAVAANFTATMAKLIALFEHETGHQVRASFGSTGKLYAQIRHGAPYDAFMAADAERPRLLADQGLAVAGSQIPYAEGRLVLWSRDPNLFRDGREYLNSQPQRLAIGNPKTAPYGIAAIEVLENLGLAGALSPKLVSGDSIAQTFQFIATGNARAGFVAQAQVRAYNDEEGSAWQVPKTLHKPISQHAVLLNRGHRNAAAHDWMAFLNGAKAQAIIREDGYDIPRQSTH